MEGTLLSTFCFGLATGATCTALHILKPRTGRQILAPQVTQSMLVAITTQHYTRSHIYTRVTKFVSILSVIRHLITSGSEKHAAF